MTLRKSRQNRIPFCSLEPFINFVIPSILLLSCFLLLSVAEDKRTPISKDSVIESVGLPADYMDGSVVSSFRSRHFTPILSPREETCFSVNLQKDDTLTINMQVLRGGDGRVWLFVRDSKSQKKIDSRMPSKQASKVITAKVDGGYDICLSNKYTSAYSKVVSIDISISQEALMQQELQAEGEGDALGGSVIVNEETEKDDPFREDSQRAKQEAEREEVQSLQRIKKLLRSLQIQTGRTRMAFSRLRAVALKDTYFQRDQLTWINTWSSVVCVFIVGVYLAEVFLIRHWFNLSHSPGGTNKHFMRLTGMKMGL